MKKRQSLPFNSWPDQDQNLWQKAQSTGSLFEADGHAAHWAVATRIQVEKGYAKWLGFLSKHHKLDKGQSPSQRATEQHIMAYVDWMNSCDLASVTLASRATDLREAIRVMEPGADLSLIQKVISALHIRSSPSRNKHNKIMHPEEMLKKIRHELDIIQDKAADNIKIRATWYRDALIFAILVCRPIRRKNITGIRLGTHLIKSNNEWSCQFTGEEMKDHIPLSFTFPIILEPYLISYLEQYRPILLDGRKDDHLWISIRRNPMSSQAIYWNICRLTERLFGKRIYPHLLRDCAASALATDDPEHILAAARILGHASLKTTNKHYNQSQMTAAGKIHNDLLEEIKNMEE